MTTHLTGKDHADSTETLAELQCVLLDNGDFRFSSKEVDLESGRPRYVFGAQRAKKGSVFNIFDIHQLDAWSLIDTMVEDDDDDVDDDAGDDGKKSGTRLSTDHASFVGSVTYETMNSGNACVETTDKIGRPVAALFCENTGFRKVAQDILQRAFCCYPFWNMEWDWDFFFCDDENMEVFASALGDMSSGRSLAAGVKLSSSGIYTASSANELSTAKAYVGTVVAKGPTGNGENKPEMVICMEDPKMDGGNILVGYEESVVNPYHAVGFVLGQLLVREARGPRLSACQRLWRCCCLPLWLAKMCLLLAVFFVVVAAIWHYLIYVPFQLDEDWAPAFPWNWNW